MSVEGESKERPCDEEISVQKLEAVSWKTNCGTVKTHKVQLRGGPRANK